MSETLMAFACAKCGRTLRVPPGLRFVVCDACGSQLLLESGGGARYSTVLSEEEPDEIQPQAHSAFSTGTPDPNPSLEWVDDPGHADLSESPRSDWTPPPLDSRKRRGSEPLDARVLVLAVLAVVAGAWCFPGTTLGAFALAGAAITFVVLRRPRGERRPVFPRLADVSTQTRIALAVGATLALVVAVGQQVRVLSDAIDSRRAAASAALRVEEARAACEAARAAFDSVASPTDASEGGLLAARTAASCGPLPEDLRIRLVSFWTKRGVGLAEDDAIRAADALSIAVDLGGRSAELSDAVAGVFATLVDATVEVAKRHEEQGSFLAAAEAYRACAGTVSPLPIADPKLKPAMSAADCGFAAAYSQAKGELKQAEEESSSKKAPYWAYNSAAKTIEPAASASWRDAARLKSRWERQATSLEQQQQRESAARDRRAHAFCDPKHAECIAAGIQEELLWLDCAAAIERKDEAKARKKAVRSSDGQAVRDAMEAQYERWQTRVDDVCKRHKDTQELKRFHCRELDRCVSSWLDENQ